LAEHAGARGDMKDHPAAAFLHVRIAIRDARNTALQNLYRGAVPSSSVISVILPLVRTPALDDDIEAAEAGDGIPTIASICR
jgi:hypothetical protein